MVRSYLFSNPLTPEQNQAVGEVAVASTILERQIEWCIAFICDFGVEEAEIWIGSMQIGAKLNVLTDLMPLKKKLSKRKLVRLKELKDSLSDTISNRNTIIHGQWGVDLSKAGKSVNSLNTFFEALKSGRYVASHRANRSKTTRTMKAENIHIVAKRLHVCVDLLIRFWADCFLEKKIRGTSLVPKESFEQLLAKARSLRLSN
jgi:hypothetical protein